MRKSKWVYGLPGMGPLAAMDYKGPGIMIHLKKSWEIIRKDFYRCCAPVVRRSERKGKTVLIFPNGVCYTDGMGLLQVFREAPNRRPMLLPCRLVREVAKLHQARI